jgi:hypothetical protein
MHGAPASFPLGQLLKCAYATIAFMAFSSEMDDLCKIYGSPERNNATQQYQSRKWIGCVVSSNASSRHLRYWVAARLNQPSQSRS